MTRSDVQELAADLLTRPMITSVVGAVRQEDLETAISTGG